MVKKSECNEDPVARQLIPFTVVNSHINSLSAVFALIRVAQFYQTKINTTHYYDYVELITK